MTDSWLSDHVTVLCNLHLKKPDSCFVERTFRKIKNISVRDFHDDLAHGLSKHGTNCVEEMVNHYNSTVETVQDTHAPKITSRIAVRPQRQWFTEDIWHFKQKKRQAERRWRHSRTEHDYQCFMFRKQVLAEQIKLAKQRYYSSLIRESKSDPKTLFRVIRSLLYQNKSSALPRCSSDLLLANQFSEYLFHKVSNIRAMCDQVLQEQPNADKEQVCVASMSEFENISQDGIRRVIARAPTKSCTLDPMPTSLLKNSLDVVLPTITDIINTSLITGVFPSTFKSAVVIPLLKKPNLDVTFNSFRPISNLSFLSKLVERVVANQLTIYMNQHDLGEPLQSAYKAFHSTETALLTIQNDILQSIDDKKVVLLLMLDLSVAFDTVDHAILLSRLESRFGITGTVLQWLESYLKDRKQHVLINDSQSCDLELKWGVPQGSVLGPLLFTAYISPIGDIFRKYGLKHHLYADDSQAYVPCEPTGFQVSTLEACVSEVRMWVVQNQLKLNNGKTEFMIIGKKSSLSKVPETHVTIGCEDITGSSTVRNLGVSMDKEMAMTQHINNVCKSSHLRNIQRIRPYLTIPATEAIVHDSITSRLDYCNSLLHGTTKTDISKLQRVQNSAARLITGGRKYDHVTPMLKHLHWLPVHLRIEFKVLLLVYKALHGMAPDYLSNMLSPARSVRNLRSRNQCLLAVPRTNLVSAGDRAFSVAGPKLWNKLPMHIKQSSNVCVFKRKLKTHLFNQFYN